MKTCRACIYWHKVNSIKDFGVCCISVPHWVIVENYDNIVHKQSRACEYFEEGQEEVCSQEEEEQMPVKYYKDKGMIHAVYGSSSIDYVEKLLKKNKELEDKLCLAKVQESFTRPIVDEYGKAS